MRILVQRVKKARVIVEYKIIAEINRGFLLFVGVGKEDNDGDIRYLVKKIINLRIFEDQQGKINLDLQQINGQILSVSQFSLYANTLKGNRPGFEEAAVSMKAEKLWREFNLLLRKNGIIVKEGIFGAHMNVESDNDGPLTIWLDSKLKNIR